MHFSSGRVGKRSCQDKIQTHLLLPCIKLLGWTQGRSGTCHVPKPSLLKKPPRFATCQCWGQAGSWRWLCTMPPLPVRNGETPCRWKLSPHGCGCPSPALALSLPRWGRKPENTFWWEQRAWQAHKYHTAYPSFSVLWGKRLTLRKHLITLDLCHFAAYLNELKGRAGSSRDWGNFMDAAGLLRGRQSSQDLHEISVALSVKSTGNIPVAH